jgi:uncharacterized protein
LKYRVEDVPEEGRKEQFSMEEGWLNERLAAERERTFRFCGPIVVQLELSRLGRVIFLHSRIEARVEWICARCLEPFPLPLKSEYKVRLEPRPNHPLPEEVELSREDLETEFYDTEEVDVAPLVQDQILLTLPFKAVCTEGCRGLCPRCGRNLNQGTCRCLIQEMDPRLAILKNFRVH